MMGEGPPENRVVWFLEGMLSITARALMMAHDALAKSSNTTIRRFARQVIVAQRAETSSRCGGCLAVGRNYAKPAYYKFDNLFGPLERGSFFLAARLVTIQARRAPWFHAAVEGASAPAFSGQQLQHRGVADGEIENALKVGESTWPLQLLGSRRWKASRTGLSCPHPDPLARSRHRRLNGDLLGSHLLEAASVAVCCPQKTTTASSRSGPARRWPPAAAGPGALGGAPPRPGLHDGLHASGPVYRWLQSARRRIRLLGQQLVLEDGKEAGSEAMPPA